MRREAGLLARDRSVWTAWWVVLVLAALAVTAGHLEIRQQQTALVRMVEADRLERTAVLAAQTDWGSAAYHAFHLTFDPPSDFAFAALGRRDDTAWRHRVRMLALEGQIHERDAGHPVLALIGRFDFAFLAAFVLPLILIVLMHDLRASERRAGRHDLLLATAARPSTLWGLRAALRAAGVFIGAALPMLVGGALHGTAPSTLLAACGLLAAHLAFWTVVCVALAAWRQSSETLLATLLGLWVLLSVVMPAAGRMVIDRAVPVPSGAQILLTQREAVNDAWDLPKASTMDAFVQRHPQWAADASVERPFEWKWYYAFQQVGDQKAEELSQAYTRGRLERERWAGRLAVISPPVLLERGLQALARTDLRASLAYEARVRDFHAALRRFHYPKLFRNEAFEPAALEALPRFDADPPSATLDAWNATPASAAPSATPSRRPVAPCCPRRSSTSPSRRYRGWASPRSTAT